MEISTSLKDGSLAEVVADRKTASIRYCHGVKVTDLERRSNRGRPAFSTLFIDNGSFGSVVFQMELEEDLQKQRHIYIGECYGEDLDHMCVVQVRRNATPGEQVTKDFWYLRKDGEWASFEPKSPSALSSALPDDAFRIPLPALAPDVEKEPAGTISD